MLGQQSMRRLGQTAIMGNAAPWQSVSPGLRATTSPGWLGRLPCLLGMGGVACCGRAGRVFSRQRRWLRVAQQMGLRQCAPSSGVRGVCGIDPDDIGWLMPWGLRAEGVAD